MIEYCNDLVAQFESARPKLMLMDRFVVHRNPDCLQILSDANFKVEFVPSGFTDICQPLDVAFFAGF